MPTPAGGDRPGRRPWGRPWGRPWNRPLRPLAALLDLPARLPDTRRPTLVLTLLCALLWLPGFFTLPPGDRDESRFAQATRQMVESGDYVRIRYGETERNKKPAGIHWAQAAAVHAVEALGIGDRTQIWPYRLPSLLGALVAVLATFQFGRTLVGRRAAFLGAAMLASSLVLVAEAHIAKTDAALLATIVLAMGLFGRAYLQPAAFGPGAAAGFWLSLGVGILLKGPIAPMVPLLAGITLAVADRAWRRDARPAASREGGRTGGAGPGLPAAGRGSWLRALRPGWGVPLMLLAAAPWFVAIGIATGGRFFSEAVGGDMLSKLGSGEESHWGPPGYYLLAFAVAGFPGAWIATRAAPSAWLARAQPPVRLLLAWAVPTWLLFEATATKLPHYVLPAYPAVMLLAARWAMDPLRRPAPRWLGWLATAGMVGTALALGLAGPLLPRLVDGEVLPAALLTLPFAGLLLWVLLRGARGRGGQREGLGREGLGRDWASTAMAGVLLAIPLYATVLELTLPRLRMVWVAPRVAAMVRDHVGALPGDRFAVVGFHEPSLMFAMGTGTHLLADGGAAARFLAGGPGRVAAVADRAQPDFMRAVAALGLTVQEIGMVPGINYSRGRQLALVLYRTAP
nr:glycosyltransferase family 39 protein [Roseomonas acroporae]